MLSYELLKKLYLDEQLSVSAISVRLNCSQSKVNYWLAKYQIAKRSISEAAYIKHNPDGDPFNIPKIDSLSKAELYGMGIGLYWGEGTKANKHSVRLGNSDPRLIKTFMRFLVELYGVKQADFRFGLQIFSDIDPDLAMEYWVAELGVESTQFYKIHITPSKSLGTYRVKSKYGVVTLYYHNKKLRDMLVSVLPR